MTRIDFYTRAQNRLQVACQLVGKAVDRGLRVILRAPDEATAARVDELLWTVPALSFVPHCRDGHRLCERTPVVVAVGSPRALHDDLLINLAPDTPDYFSRFQRLIEIVTDDEADRGLARSRYRFYRDRGYEIHSVDLTAPGGP
jgi:DNA polymerase III subunit chi